MTAGVLIGSLLVAFGPPALLLFQFVWTDSSLLILAIASAFVAYTWLLFTSFFWLAVPPLQTYNIWPLIVNPILAELFRGLSLLAYTRVERLADRLSVLSSRKVFVDLPAAVGMGSGAGLLLIVMRYGAVIATAAGRQAWYYDTCPAMSAYVLTSFESLMTGLLHVELTVLLLDALRRRSAMRASVPVAMHILFSAIQALTAVQNGCVAILPIQALVVIGGAWACYRVVTAPDYTGKRQVRAWSVLQQRAGVSARGSGAAR